MNLSARTWRNFYLVIASLLQFVIWSEPADAEPKANGRPVQFLIANGASEQQTISQICCEPPGLAFQEHPQTQLVTAYGRNSYWLKITGISGPGVLDFGTIVDDVRLFVVDPVTPDVVITDLAGDQIASGDRDLTSSHNAFAIAGSDSNRSIFVRIVHDNGLVIQPRFVAKDVFVKRERDALLVHASVMGASIFVVIFNLCLGLLLRKLLFVYYSAFVASLLISNLVLSGVGPAFVWTGLTGATSHIRELAIVGVSLFFGLMLYQFLETVRKSLVLRIGILFPALLSPIVGCLWFVLPQWRAHQIIASYSFLTTALVLLSIVILAAKRDHRSRLLLPTLILVTVPTTLMIIIPKNDPTLWQIGVLSIDAILIIDHLFELVILADAFLFSLLFSFAIRLAEAEAVRANQELALVQGKISQRIIDVVDVERRRIAADLHDTAGQGMLAVSARLTQLLQKEKFTSKQESEISRTANYSRGVIGDLRRISHDLHPAVIDHLGWRRAIEDLFEQFTENTGIIASLEIDVAEELLTDFQQLHLYRISQEVLTNIAKHSKAANCSGIFLVENDCLIARFWDDGKVAVQTHRPEATTAIGQMIIDQRVRALDGDVQRDLTTGQKHIGISFPLERERLDG